MRLTHSTVPAFLFFALGCGNSNSPGGPVSPGDGGTTTGGDNLPSCEAICPPVVAAHCSHGPATNADCVSGCQAILAGTCNAQYHTLYQCAGATPVYTCDASGLVTVVGCETSQAALSSCLAGGG